MVVKIYLDSDVKYNNLKLQDGQNIPNLVNF